MDKRESPEELKETLETKKKGEWGIIATGCKNGNFEVYLLEQAFHSIRPSHTW